MRQGGQLFGQKSCKTDPGPMRGRGRCCACGSGEQHDRGAGLQESIRHHVYLGRGAGVCGGGHFYCNYFLFIIPVPHHPVHQMHKRGGSLLEPDGHRGYLLLRHRLDRRLGGGVSGQHLDGGHPGRLAALCRGRAPVCEPGLPGLGGHAQAPGGADASRLAGPEPGRQGQGGERPA